MGAYLSVTCRSVSARDRMLAFLNEHLRDVPEIMPGVEAHNRAGPPQPGKTICAYAKRGLDIGYYTSAGWELEARALADNLLRWVALKVGKTKLFGHEQIPNRSSLTLHYTCYEEEPIPIVIASEHPDVPDHWEDGEGYVRCDAFGWDRSFRGPALGEDPDWDAGCSPHINALRQRKALSDPAIRAELERLDALWVHRLVPNLPATRSRGRRTA